MSIVITNVEPNLIMGNSNTTSNVDIDIDAKSNDRLKDNPSTLSLNGSNYNDKLNTSWKFSSANDDEEYENTEEDKLIDRKKNGVNGKYQQDDDEKSCECYDDANEEKIVSLTYAYKNVYNR